MNVTAYTARKMCFPIFWWKPFVKEQTQTCTQANFALQQCNVTAAVNTRTHARTHTHTHTKCEHTMVTRCRALNFSSWAWTVFSKSSCLRIKSSTCAIVSPKFPSCSSASRDTSQFSSKAASLLNTCKIIRVSIKCGLYSMFLQLNCTTLYLCVQVLIIGGHASCQGVIEQLLALIQDADLLLNLMCQKMALRYKFVTRLRKLSECICADVNFSTVFLMTHYKSLSSGNILGCHLCYHLIYPCPVTMSKMPVSFLCSTLACKLWWQHSMHSINKNFHTASKIIHNVNFLTLHSPGHYGISFDSKSQLKNLGCKSFLCLWIYVATNNKHCDSCCTVCF